MKAFANWRYYVLAAIGAIAILGIFSEPTADDTAAWLAAFILSKALGLSCGWLFFRLCRRFESRGELPELTKLSRSVASAAKPE